MAEVTTNHREIARRDDGSAIFLDCMQKWDYRFVDMPILGGGEEMERLSKAGTEGWEAVSAFVLMSTDRQGFTRQETMRVLLKRPNA
jgi:hypothetical protein